MTWAERSVYSPNAHYCERAPSTQRCRQAALRPHSAACSDRSYTYPQTVFDIRFSSSGRLVLRELISIESVDVWALSQLTRAFPG